MTILIQRRLLVGFCGQLWSLSDTIIWQCGFDLPRHSISFEQDKTRLVLFKSAQVEACVADLLQNTVTLVTSITCVVFKSCY